MSTIAQSKPSILYLDGNAQHRQEFTDNFNSSFTIYSTGSTEEGNALLVEHDIQAVVGSVELESGNLVNFFSEIRASFQDVFRFIILNNDAPHELFLAAVNQAHVYHIFTSTFTEEELKIVIHRGLDVLNQKRQLEKQIRHVEIEEASRMAENANRQKSQFLANMSHEIRTPLNAIIGMSHLVSETDLSHKQQDYIKKIKLASRNMLDIINDILDLSKIEASKLELKKS